MRQFWRKAVGLLLCLASCGDQGRPGRAKSLQSGTDSASAPNSILAADPTQAGLIDVDTLHPATESPCGATAIALEFRRPDLYFVLDGSGSMLDSIPPGAGLRDNDGSAVLLSTRFDASIWAIEKVLAEVGHRVNFGASIFPGKDDTCGPGEEVFELQPGDAVSYAVGGIYGPILKELLFGLHRHSPSGATPVAATLTDLLPRLLQGGRDSHVFLLTDGAPNCNTQVACEASACLPNLQRAILTDSAGDSFSCESPLNCCGPELLGPESCLDEPGSRQAIAALTNAGVSTYVIGIPGSDDYADVLDSLAIAGGTARPQAPLYYRVADAAELSQTVSALGQALALSCTIELTEAPPETELVNVFFDGQVVEYDSDNGWRWQGELRLKLLGTSCDLWRGGQVLQADIVAGCPSVLR